MNALVEWTDDTTAGVDAAEDEAARLARFIDWLQAHGVRLDGLSITDCDGERGVRAAFAVAEGEHLTTIPHALFMTSDAARESPLGQRLAALSPEAGDRAHLALHLLALRRDGGFWRPYVDILPRDFPGHPLFYGPAELMMLDPLTTVGAMIKSVIDACRADLARVAPLLVEEGFTSEDFRWAHACVRSRAYEIGTGDAPALALIPLADMLNHAAGHATRGRRPQRTDYVITAVRGIAAGDEVTATYGDYGNISLLAIYGFGLADNPHDGAMLTLDDQPQMVGRHGHAESVRKMFRQLRLNTPGLPARLGSLDVKGPIGIEHEHACLTKIHQACETAIGRHLSCLMDDDPLRAGIDPRSGLGRLLAAQASEKAVLWHWMMLATTAGRLLCARSAQGPDLALLRYMDSAYAGRIEALVNADRAATEAADAPSAGSA